MYNNKEWARETKRYRIIEHQLRDKSVFVVEWNDRWLFNRWGRWHAKFQTLSLEEAITKIQKIVSFKLKNK